MEIVEKRLVIETSPTACCHASTILKLPGGELLLAWFGGSREGAEDVGIYLSRREKNGNFTPPVCMAASREAHWNPVLFSPDGREVLLYYKVGQKISEWRTCLRFSEDGGKTFGEEREIAPGDRGGRGPVRNKPIQLGDGTVLAPASLEKDVWKAFVDISQDGGKSFTRSNFIETFHAPEPDRTPDRQEKESFSLPLTEQSFHHRGVIQPTLWEDEKGQVHMLLRSSEGKIYRSDSSDGGRTWTEAYPTKIPNNNSGIDLTRLSDGRILLVHNPVGENWGKRSPLSVSISEDNGDSFRKVLDLEQGPFEFSYPAVISEGREVCLTYTYKRENIAFCHLTI